MAKRTLETVEYGVGSISASGAAIIDKTFPTPEAVVEAAKATGAREVTVEKRTRIQHQELFNFAEGLKFKTVATKFSEWERVSHVDIY